MDKLSQLATGWEEEREEREAELSNDKVLRREIPWERMQKAELITEDQLALIKNFDKRPIEERDVIWEETGIDYARLFLDLLSNMNKTPDLQYILAIIDELLQDSNKIPLFLQLREEAEALPFGPFLRLLNRSGRDWFINSRASRIVASLLVASPEAESEDVKFLVRWCAEQLRQSDISDVLVGIAALQILMRKNEYRLIFYSEDGLKLLAAVLREHPDKRQLVYQTIYCLWLMAYNADIAAAFSSVNGLVRGLVDILRREDKEKVRRIALATLKNIMDKGENNEQMIHAGMMKVLGYLSQKKWGDEDIEEDIRDLIESLDKSMVVLSSFDKYKNEVLSGNLTWSPVHRSERFWKENVGRFEENNFKILGVLLELLRSSMNPAVLSIACHDIGEFVRFHPRGRKILSQLDGKVDIMKLMSNPNEEVQKHALICVQKMMVQNWEYLARANTPAAMSS